MVMNHNYEQCSLKKLIEHCGRRCTVLEKFNFLKSLDFLIIRIITHFDTGLSFKCLHGSLSVSDFTAV